MTMTGRFHFLFCLVLACSFVQVISYRCWTDDDEDKCCFCKNTSLTLEDISQKGNFGGIVSFLTGVSLNAWSPLSNKFKAQVQCLEASNNVPDVTNFTWASLLVMTAFNPLISYEPSACNIASLINASVLCLRDNDNSGMVQVLTDGTAYKYYSFTANCSYNAAVQSLNCPYDEELLPEFPAEECYENGFVYDIDTVWNIRGKYIPKKIRQTVKEMYNSCNFRDRYIAALATFELLPLNNRYKLVFDLLKFSEYILLQYGSICPKCCCDERLERLKYLRDYVVATTDSSLNGLATFYSQCNACTEGFY